ncbi:hypothetical protein ABZ829_20785 [Streptomyces xanthochromogenes]|uniref:hypothetical protein n=1 Tax=Streptomyces xanthochromogenes TaxID=67384 RepID=UPI0034138890
MRIETARRLAVPLAWSLGAALVAAAGPAAARPHLAPGHAAAKRVVLTNADDGRTVTPAVGDDVEVRLTGTRSPGATYTWSAPRSGGADTLRRTAGGVTPDGGAVAVFHVVGRGVATLTSERSCRPDPGRVCPLVVVPWKVTAQVR